MAQITCENLAAGYEVHPVVSGLDFRVDKGDYLCIVGENGSGKTTLMRTILGLQKPVLGKILFGDGLRANGIGYLPQQASLQEDFPASVCTDIPEDVLYLYRGVPFAREDSRLLLADPHTPGEDYTLSRLSAECAVLSESSDDYRDALLKNLRELLERNPDALPEARKTAADLLQGAAEPVDRREPVFVWPWDDKSPSILTVLQESRSSSVK